MTKSNTKLVGLAVVLVIIVVVIWYLERLKAPSSNSPSIGAQAINLPVAENTPEPSPVIATTSTDKTQQVVPTNSPTINPTAGLRAIALQDSKKGYTPAVEIAGPTGFVNAPDTFRLKDLIGKKVILVDFWTYSCINCLRTLPYLTAWDKKYKDQGLVIVGIHTPEFEFEKDIANVRAATQKYGINYPVVLDSNRATWQAYSNLYWPYEYLIDIAGYVVHDHVGEGGYTETEGEIQKLLTERAKALDVTMPTGTSGVVTPPQSPVGAGSPETYFGAARNEFLSNGIQGQVGEQSLTEPKQVEVNSLYLSGKWNFSSEFATTVTAGTKIIYRYRSAKVFFVGSAPKGATIEVLQDGKPITAENTGSDVKDGKMMIKESRLYNVINNQSACSPNGMCTPEEHTLELRIESPGLEAYTFTFG